MIDMASGTGFLTYERERFNPVTETSAYQTSNRPTPSPTISVSNDSTGIDLFLPSRISDDDFSTHKSIHNHYEDSSRNSPIQEHTSLQSDDLETDSCFDLQQENTNMDDLETDGPNYYDPPELLSLQVSMSSGQENVSISSIPVSSSNDNYHLCMDSNYGKKSDCDVETDTDYVQQDKSEETTVKALEPDVLDDHWPQENGCAFRTKAVDVDRRRHTKKMGNEKISKTYEDFVSLEYRHDHLYRGRCLIVSNSEFRDKYNRPRRSGSLRDANTLKKQIKAMGFHPIRTKDGSEEMIHQNLSRNDLLEILSDVTDSSLNDHSDYDCFMCVILSYGMPGAVVCPGETEDAFLETTSILEYFSSGKCPSLAMKPKLFFIQGCVPFEMTEDNAMASTPAPKEKCSMVKTIVPSMADCLVQFSGVSGCYGWGRNRNRGLSYFVQALCRSFNKFCVLKLEQGQRSQEMTSLLLTINRTFMDILEDDDVDISELFCLPTVFSTLTKHMHYYPKPPTNHLETG